GKEGSVNIFAAGCLFSAHASVIPLVYVLEKLGSEAFIYLSGSRMYEKKSGIEVSDFGASSSGNSGSGNSNSIIPSFEEYNSTNFESDSDSDSEIFVDEDELMKSIIGE